MDALHPLTLQLVQLTNGNAADVGPRTVLESVVVQELAAQKKGNSQQAPDVALRQGNLVAVDHVHHVDALGKVVHAQQNGRTRQAGGGQDLGDEFPERLGSLGGTHGKTVGHLGNVLGHHLDIVVEDGTDTTRHFEKDKMEGGKFHRSIDAAKLETVVREKEVVDADDIKV